ncbi:MAG: glycosyltransferase family 2 protein [Phascolarctobacterium sp.]|uniref:glycosyltransferase family 2 protein n=1 Tax=Phascolarctobacterium sp. TaxID=2049039 RepID=UPI0026DD29D9|nr:glycosyltransferase family 2 protein [Phascolarctobacterium sp.]MDO4921130.1 glycosyltransferase family 2 protein [Phascolarctobacterium sp.]
MQKISIVVPVFNEQENLCEFYKRVTAVMSAETYDYNIIFVDDGSSDSSAVILNELSKKDGRVEAYLLSRNYGHQMALTCGLDNADGDAVITMDGDLQHPPELLPQLLRLWEQGNEIVQTKRLATQDAGFFKKFTSNAYYKLINALSEVEITPGGSDFRLMDRIAVDAFKQYRERARFIRGLVNTLGFRVTVLEFVAPPRFAGHSKFNLHKMLHFALDGITAFSNLPLRWAFYVGLVFGVSSILLLGHVFYVKFIIDDAVPGWATMTVSVLFLGGIQLVGIGILGEYIGRIFEEIKHRPLYLVARRIKTDKSLGNK